MYRYRRLEKDQIELEPDDFLLAYADREVSDDESESGSLISGDRRLRQAAANDNNDDDDDDNVVEGNNDEPHHQQQSEHGEYEGDVAIEMDGVEADGNGAYDHHDDPSYRDHELEDQE
jgi:hypothetical protein